MDETTTVTPEATATPTPAPAAEKPPVAAPTTVAADEKMVNIVPLTVAEYNALIAERAENQRAKQEAEQKAREAQERAQERLLENGKWKEALESLKTTQQSDFARFKEQVEAERRAERDRLNAEKEQIAAQRIAAENRAKAVEQKVKKSTLDRDLAQTLAGHPLVPGGAQQLASLWSSQFTVVEDGEAYASRSLDGKSVAEFVAAQLAQPEYAHFIRSSTTKGGTIGGHGSSAVSPIPAAPDPAPVPRNMGEAVIMQIQSQTRASGDPRANMGLGFGLKANAR